MLPDSAGAHEEVGPLRGAPDASHVLERHPDRATRLVQLDQDLFTTAQLTYRCHDPRAECPTNTRAGHVLDVPAWTET